MDARERLRLYLEQRRELGESELVLDGMPVDDVMSLIGARSAPRPPRGARSPASAMVPPAPPAARDATERPAELSRDAEPAASAAHVLPPAPPEVRFDPAVTATDWRATLRESTANPGEPMSAKAPAADIARKAELPAWLSALGVMQGVAASASSLTNSAAMPLLVKNAQTLDDIASLVTSCSACALHATARNPVPGEGNPHAELVCVGEAPGANEDEQGRPFVGEAGQLLTKILAAIDLSRDSVYICNVLKHRPPANRDPLPDEVVACSPYLQRQLELVRPRVILALGRFAAQALLGTTQAIGKLRGQVHLYGDIPVIVTYHPAALLRNEAWKRPTWDDVKLARRILDASRGATPPRLPS